MKRLLILLFIIIANSVFATDWYYSNSGNDSWNGLTPSTPKQSNASLQTTANSLVAGDVIYIERGSEYEYLKLLRLTGTSTNRIQIRPYGTGANPKIKSYYSISGTWTQNGNVWTKTIGTRTEWGKYKRIYANEPYYDNFENYLNFLLIDDVPYTRGRYPNTGYYAFESVGSDERLSATDYGVTWTTNQWSNATLKFSPTDAADGAGGDNKWVMESVEISGNSSNTLNLTTGDFFLYNYLYPGSGQQHYYIANSPSCNDLNGEWSYNYITGVMSVYYTGNLNATTVEIPRYNYALEIDSCTYVDIYGIDIQGGIASTVRMYKSNYINLSECNIKYSPHAAIWVYAGSYQYINRCTIDMCCNGGVYSQQADELYVTSSVITNVGYETMGGDRFFDSYMGVYFLDRVGPVGVLYSYIYNCGYAGIGYSYAGWYSGAAAESWSFNQNVILDVCQILTDGGGMYIRDQTTSGAIKEANENIISISGGNPGLLDDGQTVTFGIYPDYNTGYADINYNTFYNCGFYEHPGTNNNFKYNNVYNAGNISGAKWQAGYIGAQDWYGVCFGSPIVCYSTDYFDCKHNNIVSTKASCYMGMWQYDGTFNAYGSTVDSNYYYNPRVATTSNLFSRMQYWTVSGMTFNTWKETTGFDASSTINYNGMNYSSSGLDDDELIKLVSNLSQDSTRIVDLYDLRFEDVYGNTVSDSVILSPKESMFLFRNTAYGTTSNMDLIPEMGWGTGYLGIEPETDTIWFEEYTTGNNIDVVWSSDCADSVVTRYLSGGGGTYTDTLIKVNLATNSAYWDLTGWSRANETDDSTLVATNIYLINQSNMSYNVSGPVSGTIWPGKVSNSLWWLPNTDNNPDTIIIRGSGLSTDYYYTILGISSRDNTGDTRNTYMYCNGYGDTVQSILNYTNWLVIDSVQATGNQLLITLDREDGKYGYLNGLIIVRKQDSDLDTTQSWVMFEDINFGDGMDSIRYAVDFNQAIPEKSFELRLDGITGTLIDSFNVDVAGCGIRGAAVDEVSGIHNLYALLDTLDQYDWMLFLKQQESVSYHNITDTFYLRLYDWGTSQEKSYSATCSDTIVTIDDYAGFYNVYKDSEVNHVDIKLNYESDDANMNILYLYDGQNNFAYYSDVDTITDCSIITISFNLLDWSSTNDIKELAIFGNATSPPEVVWMYFYYLPSKQYHIEEANIKYSSKGYRIKK